MLVADGHLLPTAPVPAVHGERVHPLPVADILRHRDHAERDARREIAAPPRRVSTSSSVAQDVSGLPSTRLAASYAASLPRTLEADTFAFAARSARESACR